MRHAGLPARRARRSSSTAPCRVKPSSTRASGESRVTNWRIWSGAHPPRLPGSSHAARIFRALRRLCHAAHGPVGPGRGQAARARGQPGTSAVSARADPAADSRCAWGYRHRARLGVRKVPKKGGVLIGFHEKRSSYIADMRPVSIAARMSRTAAAAARTGRQPEHPSACRRSKWRGEECTALVLRMLEAADAGTTSNSASLPTAHRVSSTAAQGPGYGAALSIPCPGPASVVHACPSSGSESISSRPISPRSTTR
jgi:hypothetical protein